MSTEAAAPVEPIAPTPRSLTELQAALQAAEAAVADGDRVRLDLEQQAKDLRRSPTASQKQVDQVEQRRAEVLEQTRRHREVKDKLQRAWGARTRPLEHLASARPSELEDRLELARPKRAAAERALAEHATARARLVGDPKTPDSALERHDAARPALDRQLERCTAEVTQLEEALAKARERWPALQAAFDVDLAQIKKEHTEALRLLREYLEKAAPRVAEILERSRVIDDNLAALRLRARYLQREAELPPRANDILREGQPPLYHRGALHPEVQLPGVTHVPIWPRPRGTFTTTPTKAATSADASSEVTR